MFQIRVPAEDLVSGESPPPGLEMTVFSFSPGREGVGGKTFLSPFCKGTHPVMI